MALVAGQIQPQLQGVQDYSGAAAASAMAQSAPYQMISDLAGQAKDYFKQQSDQKKLIKQSGMQIDAALKLFPEMSSVLQPYSDQIKDENIPLSERSFIASETSNYITNALNMMKMQESMNLARQREARMAADSTAASAPGGGYW